MVQLTHQIMTKMQIIISTLLLVVFGILFFTIQKTGTSSKSALSPTPDPLPTGSEYLRIISPQVQQGAQGQQQAQQQQTQQGSQVQQQAQPATLYQGELSESMNATIKTSKGDIQVVLYGADAPNTIRNFLGKAQSGYYSNLIFHRVEGWVVQGGDPTGTGTGGGKIASELNSKPFTTGALGLARTPASKEISNDSQFFIVKIDATHLNNDYVNFGMVTEGMEIVNSIAIGDKILSITLDE